MEIILFICGGEQDPNKFEYYDINKNKWILLSDTINAHKYWPIMWNYDVNILIIGSVFKCKSFEIIDIRENKWNNFNINDIETFDELFGININANKSDSRLLI